ncbi:MAG: rane protein involved in the export of O-antigen and teichoic acid [Herminiimonas sp.]|nr:rane protein involved in the export of O-antigen and teichoic acid [Herminiimonas sp.]
MGAIADRIDGHLIRKDPPVRGAANLKMSKTSPTPTDGRAIAVNTLWNIAGAGAPLIVAVFSIPLIIRGLGVDRFGLLALAWTVIGYFGAFDLGLGVATTKFIAEFRQQGRHSDLFRLVLTSAILHLGLGMIGAGVLAGVTGWLVFDVLNVPVALRTEARTAFYILALSIPVIVITACFRGALEGLHRFDLVNLIKIPASIANYVTPLLVLWFTPDLGVIVAVIAATRIAVLASYAWLALRAIAPAAYARPLDAAMLPALLRFGGWLSVSNFVTPIMVSLDRFLIGAFVSAGAITYYATPYEVITKLWIFSAGLLGVLLPVFSAMSVDGAENIREVMRQAVRILLAAVAPCIGLVLALSGDLLQFWVGAEFRTQSTTVACWIAIGMLFNVVAQVPLTALHGLGRTDITAKILFAELVVYAAFAFLMVEKFGINGVAFAWAARACLDALLLFIAGARILPGSRNKRITPPLSSMTALALFLIVLYSLGITTSLSLPVKIASVTLILAGMSLWEWRYLLIDKDRESALRLILGVRAKLSSRHQL